VAVFIFLPVAPDGFSYFVFVGFLVFVVLFLVLVVNWDLDSLVYCITHDRTPHLVIDII